MNARIPSAHEDHLFELSKKADENVIPDLNELLGRLITLDTAFIGGGFVAAKGDAIPFWWAVAVIVIMMVSLVIAFAGVYPRLRKNVFGDVEAYRVHRAESIDRKWHAMIFSSLLFVAGLVVATVGLVCRGVGILAG